MNKRSFGRIGENSAALFLEKKGFKVVGKNVYVGRCEIDLIAKNDSKIIFVEVKTRRQLPGTRSKYGYPGSAVDYRKKSNLLLSAKKYLTEHRNEVRGLNPRIDVIEIYVDPTESVYKVLEIKHFPNAVHN